MVMYAKIRRMYFRERLSINEIKRRTSLSRNTIKKWLAAEAGIELKYRRHKSQTTLTAYEEQLRQWLETEVIIPSASAERRSRCLASYRSWVLRVAIRG